MNPLQEFLGEPRKEPEGIIQNWEFIRDLIEDDEDIDIAVCLYVRGRYSSWSPLEQFSVSCEIEDKLDEIGYGCDVPLEWYQTDSKHFYID